MAAKRDISQAKARFDGSVARIRDKARELAYRARPYLPSDQQRLLDEVVRLDDPRRILVGTYFLLKEELPTFVDLERYLKTIMPSINRVMGLLQKIHGELERLDRAELRYEIAKRKWAAASTVGEHEASTKSEIPTQRLKPNASGSEVGKSSKGPELRALEGAQHVRAV
jgi:hypothetical protein